MRLSALSLLLALLAVPALAAETEGLITSVDPQTMTITLDDGTTYRLPAEIDMTAVSDGMEVVVVYRVGGDGMRQITDMLLPE